MKALSFPLIFLAFYLLGFPAGAQNCHPDSLQIRSLPAPQTDPMIGPDSADHLIFINPDCPSNHKVLLHLMGTWDQPSTSTKYASLAANQGFKVIVLKYPNYIPTSLCDSSIFLQCHENFREEVSFGTPRTLLINVDSANSIYNRFAKALLWLKNQYPGENWGDFLLPNNEVIWDSVIVSGHSQGGGHAAYLAKRFSVNRLIMFSAPNEYNSRYSQVAPWITTQGQTSVNRMYGFGHEFDEAVNFSKHLACWMALGIPGDSLDVKGQTCPFDNQHMLYSRDTSITGFGANHNSTILDPFTPLDSLGAPLFTTTWKYLLGLCDTVITSVLPPASSQLRVYPNPTSGEIYIRLSETIESVRLLDLQGRCLRNWKDTSSIPVYQADVPPGIYFVQILDARGQIHFSKIQIQAR